MGVPAFYRWLSEKYPKIIVDCVETQAQVVDGVAVPVDTSTPNPNGMEFDNLYLVRCGCLFVCCVCVLCVARFGLGRRRRRRRRSNRQPRHNQTHKKTQRQPTTTKTNKDMNGIIHPCFHPEDRVRCFWWS